MCVSAAAGLRGGAVVVSWGLEQQEGRTTTSAAGSPWPAWSSAAPAPD